MKTPYEIILRPHITEKTVALSYGSEELADEQNVRTYTFVVAGDANKIEIKAAIEALYNADKKKDADKIKVTRVATVSVKGKSRRVGFKSKGKRPDWKKAYVTLAPGQVLEDYGV